MAEIVPATPALVEAWYGGRAPFTLRGWVAVENGRPIGIAGVYWVDGVPVAFSEWRPEVDKRTAARGVRLVRELLAEFRIPVYAVCGTGTAWLLEKLGFRSTGEEALGGPLMERRPC